MNIPQGLIDKILKVYFENKNTNNHGYGYFPF